MHIDEPEEMVIYLKRSVPKRGFRAYIYSSDGLSKIVNSWDEFELYTHSNQWFPTKEEAEIPKKTRKKAEA